MFSSFSFHFLIIFLQYSFCFLFVSFHVLLIFRSLSCHFPFVFLSSSFMVSSCSLGFPAQFHLKPSREATTPKSMFYASCFKFPFPGKGQFPVIFLYIVFNYLPCSFHVPFMLISLSFHVLACSPHVFSLSCHFLACFNYPSIFPSCQGRPLLEMKPQPPKPCSTYHDPNSAFVEKVWYAFGTELLISGHHRKCKQTSMAMPKSDNCCFLICQKC